MTIQRSFIFLTLALLAQGQQFFEPCSKDDIKCLSTATEKFLEASKNGIPGTNVMPVDPLILPSIDVVIDENSGLVFHYKNLNITGLKNQKVNDYKMDTDKKTIVLKTQVELNIVADITIEFTKKSKTFSGSYTAVANALGTSKYTYSLRINPKDNLEYFDVGPETNKCEIVGEPTVRLDEELMKALHKDGDAISMKPDYEAHLKSLRQKALCKIIEKCYARVIHNLRESAKFLPKSAFFKDI